MPELFNIQHPTDLSEYTSTVTDGGDLSQQPGAGLGGTTGGMQVVLDDTVEIYGLKSFTQITNTSYRFTYHIDPNTLTMASGDRFFVCAMQDSGSYRCRSSLRFDGVNYEINAQARLDDLSGSATGQHDITDVEHCVEILLEYASSAIANDGRMVLWIDGIQQEEVTGLDIFTISKPDEGRLGAFDGIDVGTSGTFFLDEFVVRDDDTEIGCDPTAEPEPPTPPEIEPTIPPTPTSGTQSRELTVQYNDPLWVDATSSAQNIEFSDYGHELRAVGGYYSAKIQIDDRQDLIEDWIESGIGRHITSYNPELEVIGEFFVNKITATIGALQYSIGPLIAVGNRLKVRYSIEDTTVDPPIRGEQTETSVANNTDSQVLFGIIEKVISVNSATATEADQIRDSILADVSRAYPATSRKSTLGGANPRLTLDCLGYWHWLNTYLYNNSATGQVNLSDKIIAILAAELNSILSTDTSKVTSNTTQVSDAEDKDKTALTVMKYLNSLGDAANNRYNMGFYGGRVFEYTVAPSEVAYHQRITGNQGITTPIGGKVDPWNVLPARWMFYPDFLVGRNPPITSSTLSSDPRAGFIEVVKFSLPDTLSINGSKLDESDVLLERLGLKGTP